MKPIAIVGMGCRFPGAADLHAYWRLLREGVDAIREVPAERWDLRKFYDPAGAEPGKMTTRWGGFLDRVDAFDPSFFGISPREAAYMDPQQRLLLEVAWEALEDAGMPLDRCSGRPAGVFVGISTYDYGALQLSAAERIVDGYGNTGSALSVAANRISYLFDLRGPSVAIDTACSSSLAAVHLACQSLLGGESSLALAGGVNVILSPAATIGFSKLKAMAADGRCKSFDARADGYVRSEGAGFVVLKPLADALQDGDHVYAVVRGSAMNQDGRTNGLTAPNGLSQEALIREALTRAGIEPRHIGYVEAHGTGTPLGDPIELNALGAALADGRPPGSRCVVGSVKSNLGHLEAAAGVAGLIKVALALDHREIPPSLHFETPNPHIPFDTLPLEVARALRPWPEGPRPAAAGVSSFGFGGTNVHVVLEEAPSAGAPASSREEPQRACLLPLSAKSEEALQALGRAWCDLLRPSPEVSAPALADLAYTSSSRRTHHDHRLTVVARSREELRERLAAHLAGEASPGVAIGRAARGRRRKLAFVFPGQGSQWSGMARGLLLREPAFKDALERCAAAIHRQVGWSLLEELHADGAPSRLSAVDVIQPALWAIQVSLAALWRSWGVTPDAVVGHSMGEVAAAHVAGALSLDDAASVICRRSRLLRSTSGRGAMAAVELSIEQAREALSGYEDRVSVAVSNSPSSTVLSGEVAALEEILRALEARNVFCRRVKVDVASHSPQMDPLRADLLAALATLGPTAPAVPLYSTVTGEKSAELPLDARYWVRNLREPVLFSRAVERLVRDGHSIFLELSPHPILLAGVQQTLQHLGKDGAVLPSLRREEDEQSVMLGSLGALFALGRPVDWTAVSPADGRLTRLPFYPWQRERYWIEAGEAAPAERPLDGHAPRHVQSPVDGTHFWECELRADGSAGAQSGDPAAGVYADLVTTACRQAFAADGYAVETLELREALPPEGHGVRRVQIVLTPAAGDTASFQVYTRPPAPGSGAPAATLHAVGTVGRRAAVPVSALAEPHEAHDDWFHAVRWESARLPAGEGGVASSRSPGSWLVLADRGGLGQALRARLQAHGESCTLVEPGDDRRDLEEALAAPTLRGIVHLWSLDIPPIAATPAPWDAAVARGCASVVGLLKSLGAGRRRAAPRLWLVTRGAQPVGAEGGALAPEQAPLLGLARTAALEHPELRCTSVDLGTGTPEADALFAELWADGDEQEVALRGDERHVARLVRSPPEAAPPRASLRADATYLITGGLGGLGLATARWMVEHGARHLLLLGRSGASAAAEPLLEEMRQAGARVMVARADVAEAAELSAALAHVGLDLPPLRGVVHAAGRLEDGILLQLDEARFASVLRPKATGAWNLHQLTAGHPLDFFVLFSSAASVLGSPGQGNYAAANAFLDALAHHRRAQGRPAVSVNWGPWSEVGLAVRPDRGARLAVAGFDSLSPRQGLSAFARVFAGSAPQVAVVLADWAALRRRSPAVAASPLLRRLTQDAPGSRPETGAVAAGLTAAAVLAHPPGERQRVLEEHLRQQVALVLKLPAVRLDLQRPLSTLGIDSLMAVELKNRVETDLQVSLPLIQLIQGPTVAELAGMVLEQMAPGDVVAAAPAARLEPARPAAGGPLLLALMDLREGKPGA